MLVHKYESTYAAHIFYACTFIYTRSYLTLYLFMHLNGLAITTTM